MSSMIISRKIGIPHVFRQRVPDSQASKWKKRDGRRFWANHMGWRLGDCWQNVDGGGKQR